MLLGHEQLATTERYTHIQDVEILRQALNQAGKVVKMERKEGK